MNFDNNYGQPSHTTRNQDLMLSVNEYVYVQSRTDGNIKTHVGPLTLPISAQEILVKFNTKTKKFEEVTDFEKAKQLFVSAPEGWYVTLKNPIQGNTHPEAGKPNITPANILIGTKINIQGPESFALYPGQMAKVARGHRLRSNQYLLARVYDAEAAMNGIESATIVDADGNITENKKNIKYFTGQLLVIKGTEVSFYIPPTGIEVIPIEGTDEYIRDAVTLERLEYAILKDENGEKTYHHGPAVVFPKPTEVFVTTPKKGVIFRALELSPISGIYVKVIAPYVEKDKNGKEIKHQTGEELFITGKEQMIYYPRPEHAIIQYDGKYMHHAIAIPKGEGRYILDRIKGSIKTVKGPCMYLPDPRTEVVVKRKLTEAECNLMYPNNNAVVLYNDSLSEKAMEKLARAGKADAVTDAINMAYSTVNQEKSLAIFEANSNISRGSSYTKPRTITLDTKFDGVVSIDVWNGYAINIVAKDGKQEVVVGPTTRLLDYDETVTGLHLSTGKPKTTDKLLSTAFLQIKNNKVTDIITAKTKDFVNVDIKVSYCVDFIEEFKDNWFDVDNYVKFLCDKMRTIIKKELIKYDVKEFYSDSTNILTNIILNKENQKFPNGMIISDVDILKVIIDNEVQRLFENAKYEHIEKAIALNTAKVELENEKELAATKKEEIAVKEAIALAEIETQKVRIEAREKQKMAEIELEHARKKAEKDAKKELSEVEDFLAKAELERNKLKDDARIETEKKLAEIEKERYVAYAETVAKIMESVSPDLVASLNAKANADILNGLGQSVAPYAIANGESVAEVVNTMLRGTSLENTLKNIKTFDVK